MKTLWMLLLVLFCASSVAQAQVSPMPPLTPMPDPIGEGGIDSRTACEEILNELARLTREKSAQELRVKAARERWEPFALATEQAWMAYTSALTIESRDRLFLVWVSAIFAEAMPAMEYAMELDRLRSLRDESAFYQLLYVQAGC